MLKSRCVVNRSKIQLYRIRDLKVIYRVFCDVYSCPAGNKISRKIVAVGLQIFTSKWKLQYCITEYYGVFFNEVINEGATLICAVPAGSFLSLWRSLEELSET